LLAFNPLSVGVITAGVVADSLVDGAAVVEFTVQSVRHRTALRRNRCGVVAFIETTLRRKNIFFLKKLLFVQTVSQPLYYPLHDGARNRAVGKC